MIKDLFLSRRIDQRKNEYRNLSFFRLFFYKVLYDIVSIIIFSLVGYLVFYSIGLLLSLIGVNELEFKFIDYVISWIAGLFNLNNPELKIKSVYSFRLLFLMGFTLYYFISKILRSSLIRGSKGTLSNSMNVQLKTVILIKLVNIVFKVLIEIVLLSLLSGLLLNIINLFNGFTMFAFKSSFLSEQIQSSFIIFILVYVILWHFFTKPLWYAKLKSKDYEGNYVFSFYGSTVYVGNADDGVSSRLTKYYNNRGASDTAKIYYRRFHLRVLYLYTYGSGKFVEDCLYILLGAPIINTKNTWGHIR